MGSHDNGTSTYASGVCGAAAVKIGGNREAIGCVQVDNHSWVEDGIEVHDGVRA